MPVSKPLFAVSSGLLIASLGGMSGAVAQSASAELKLEEIIVTAQRRQENLREVPISINALSADDLQQYSIGDAAALQFATPGLTYPVTAGVTSPFIRGRGSNFSGSGLEIPVAIYVDDVYQQTQFSTNGFMDVAQVQVLKGPQGTLYGRNATGGSILITTTDPTEKLEGHVQVGTGNISQKSAEGVVNVPINETLAVRFAGEWESFDGFVRNVVDGRDHGSMERSQARMKISWRPSDEFSVLLKGEVGNAKRGYLSSLLRDGTGTSTGLDFHETMQSPPAPKRLGGENREKMWSTTLKLAYETEGWSLSNVTGYRDTEYKTCVDNDYLYPELFLFCTYSPSDPRAPGGVDPIQDKTLTNELRLTTLLSGPLNYLVGLSYQHSDGHFPGVISGALFGPLLGIMDNSIDIKSTAVYGEVYYKFAEGWKMTLGGRYTKDEKEVRGRNNADIGPIVQIPPAFLPASFEQDDSWSDFTPRAVVSYATGNANYYLSYNEAFKSGGFNTPTPVPQPALEPEKTTGYELGGKFDVLGGRGRLSVAAFYSETSDVQVSTIDAASGGVVQENAAKVEAKGVEADFALQATKNLNLGLAVSYLESEFKNYINASVFSLQGGIIGPGSEDLSGTETPHSPKLTGTVNAKYDFALLSSWTADIVLLARYSDGYSFAAGAGGPLRADRQGDYTVVNVSGQIHSPSDQFTLTLYASNVTDEEYYERIQTNAGFGIWGTPALPRMYGVKLGYSF